MMYINLKFLTTVMLDIEISFITFFPWKEHNRMNSKILAAMLMNQEHQ